jgi:hypothetical protein
MAWRLPSLRHSPRFGHQSYSTTSGGAAGSNFNSYSDIPFEVGPDVSHSYHRRLSYGERRLGELGSDLATAPEHIVCSLNAVHPARTHRGESALRLPSREPNPGTAPATSRLTMTP